MVTKVCQSLSHHLHSAVNIGAFLTICWQLWGTKNFMNKVNLWFYFYNCTRNNKAVQKASAVFLSASLTSSIRPGIFTSSTQIASPLKLGVDKDTSFASCCSEDWLWWWMFHDLISGECDTDHVGSGWKENCPAFPRLPWAICCRALTSAAVSYRTSLCLKKVVSLARLFFLAEMCMVQSNSSLQPKNHSASSCKEVLIGTLLLQIADHSNRWYRNSCFR